MGYMPIWAARGCIPIAPALGRPAAIKVPVGGDGLTSDMFCKPEETAGQEPRRREDRDSSAAFSRCESPEADWFSDTRRVIFWVLVRRNT